MDKHEDNFYGINKKLYTKYKRKDLGIRNKSFASRSISKTIQHYWLRIFARSAWSLRHQWCLRAGANPKAKYSIRIPKKISLVHDAFWNISESDCLRLKRSQSLYKIDWTLHIWHGRASLLLAKG